MTTNQVGYLPQFYVSASLSKRIEWRICQGEKSYIYALMYFFREKRLMYDFTNIGPDSNEIPSVNCVKFRRETLKIGQKWGIFAMRKKFADPPSFLHTLTITS